MRILILGGTGMLGHRLWIRLQPRHEVWVTVRGEVDPFPRVPEFPPGRICHRVDAQHAEDLTRTLASVRPELVINCIGLVKQSGLANDPVLAIALNALLPHQLSSLCRAADARLIHISTDCVFSGRKGNYSEGDRSDAEDLYGRSKALGEVAAPHALTIRTSIIGQELASRLGLVEWFLAQTGTISGYRKAIFSGLTTDELARVILEHVVPRPELSGLWQVASQPISKYDLLVLAREAYGREITILPDETFVCDRSLDPTRFQSATGYVAPPWPTMMREMASHASFYEHCRRAGNDAA
jgi:dTDP-4-dehydrorhamnose reductase